MIHFPWALFRRLVFVEWLLVLTTLCAAGLGARNLFKESLVSQSQKQQEDTLAVLSAHWSPEPDWCKKASAMIRFRLTLIAPDGAVTCDSEGDPQTMDNHASRPEIRHARETGMGHSFRHSSTIGEEMLYSAVRVAPPPLIPPRGDWFIRSSVHLSELGPTLSVFDRSLAAFLALTALILAVVSLFSARTLVLPLSSILRKFKQDGARSGDWNELERSINSLSEELNQRLEELLTERSQQSTVLSAISDGILAVDRAGLPLFFNSRFELYFGQNRSVRQMEYWKIFREPDLLASFENAIHKSERSTLNFVFNADSEGKRYFSVSVSPLSFMARWAFSTISPKSSKPSSSGSIS